MKVADIAARMTAAQNAADKAAKQTVATAALKAKLAIQSGSPARLRGVGKSGAKLGVSYRLSGAGARTTATVRATGPWQLIEEDTRPHVIRSKRRGRKKGRGGQGAIVIPGVGPRVAAHHPGTRGKHPWAKGVEKAMPLVAAEMRTQVTNTVLAALRG